MSADLPQPLRGIIPPLVTPLAGPDDLDLEALERLVPHLLDGGVSGLFVLGSTGEGPSLGYRLRRELVAAVCRLVGGRVPVLVGITDPAFPEAVAQAGVAATAGAAAVVAAAPYYFRPSAAELGHYVAALAEAVPLPLFLYNMPQFTRTAFPAEVLRRAMDLPNVVGVKDSSGDMGHFHTVRAMLHWRPDWTLLIGPEHLTAEAVLFGGHGGVNGGANLFPRLFVDLYEAAVRRDVARLDALQQVVIRLQGVYRVNGGETAFIKGLKCALAQQGLCDEATAEPFLPVSDEERERIRHLVGEVAEAAARPA